MFGCTGLRAAPGRLRTQPGRGRSGLAVQSAGGDPRNRSPPLRRLKSCFFVCEKQLCFSPVSRCSQTLAGLNLGGAKVYLHESPRAATSATALLLSVNPSTLADDCRRLGPGPRGRTAPSVTAHRGGDVTAVRCTAMGWDRFPPYSLSSPPGVGLAH